MADNELLKLVQSKAKTWLNSDIDSGSKQEIENLIKRVKDYEIELNAMKKAIEGLEEVTPAAQKTLDKKETYYKNLLSELEKTGYEEG